MLQAELLEKEQKHFQKKGLAAFEGMLYPDLQLQRGLAVLNSTPEAVFKPALKAQLMLSFFMLNFKGYKVIERVALFCHTSA